VPKNTGLSETHMAAPGETRVSSSFKEVPMILVLSLKLQHMTTFSAKKVAADCQNILEQYYLSLLITQSEIIHLYGAFYPVIF
jgi:hypothetical protein